MEWLLNAGQMKAFDERTIRGIGIPSAVLMERAALSVAEEMKNANLDLSRVLVVCGSGNNGGDGFAIARILAGSSFTQSHVSVQGDGAQGHDISRPRVTIAFVGKESSVTEETALQRKICENLGLKVSRYFMDDEYTVIVDAIFGIGLSRPVEGHYAEVIRWMNAQSAMKVAVDIPSGISAEDGRIYGVCVKADLTVTFACRKVGQILYPGASYCGRIICRDIGIPAGEWLDKRGNTGSDCSDGSVSAHDAGETSENTAVVYTYTKRDLALLQHREAYSNKGTFGKVLLIAGSEGMSGAAILAAKGAFRSGCGMVRIFTPECNRAILQTALPEAMVSSWSPDGPEENTKKRLADALRWADVIGIGPGLGMSPMAGVLLDFVLEHCGKPLVIDADGLNLLAKRHNPVNCRNVILTPHIGEMARLTGKDRMKIASELLPSVQEFAAAQGVVCVLKDARTAVSDGNQVYLNTSGNDGMAVAGSGDVLTGVICGLLAQHLPCWTAATLGVYLHGLAGDLAKKELGAHGMMAGDIADRVGAVLRGCAG